MVAADMMTADVRMMISESSFSVRCEKIDLILGNDSARYTAEVFLNHG